MRSKIWGRIHAKTQYDNVEAAKILGKFDDENQARILSMVDFETKYILNEKIDELISEYQQQQTNYQEVENTSTSTTKNNLHPEERTTYMSQVIENNTPELQSSNNDYDESEKVKKTLNSEEIEENLKSAAYQTLSGKLNNWYPTITDFNNEFVTYLKSQNVSIEDIKTMSLSKKSFEAELGNFQDFFSSLKVESKEALIYQRVSEALDDTKPKPAQLAALKTNLKQYLVVDDSFSIEFVYNLKKLVQKVRPIIMRESALINFEVQLNDWYPESNEVNEIVLTYFRSNINVTRIEIMSMTKDAQTFYDILKIHVQFFPSSYQTATTKAIIARFKSTLKKNYKNNVYQHMEIFNRNKKNLLSLQDDAIYDPNFLRSINNLISASISELDLRSIYASLETKIKGILPGSANFTRSFTNFLKNQNSTLNELRQLYKTDFLKDRNVWLQTYKEEMSEEYTNFIYEKMSEALREMDPQSFEKNLGEVEELKNIIDLKLTADTDSFKKYLDKELDKINYNMCLIETKPKILKLLSANAQKELRSYFSENQCISAEICNRLSVFDGDTLKIMLQEYISGFQYATVASSEVSANNVIQDEIDYAIYEVLRTALKTTETNADCIVDYIIRTKAEFYSTDLLFATENQLVKSPKIEVLVKKYKKIYEKKPQTSIAVTGDNTIKISKQFFIE